MNLLIVDEHLTVANLYHTIVANFYKEASQIQGAIGPEKKIINAINIFASTANSFVQIHPTML